MIQLKFQGVTIHFDVHSPSSTEYEDEKMLKIYPMTEEPP